MENQTTITNIPRSEDQALANFYFLIFTPNPNTDTARVFIDDGSIRMVMKVDRLCKIVKELCNEKLSKLVRAACNVYGDFFILDRDKLLLRQLDNIIENEKLSCKQLKEMCSEESESTGLRAQYLRSLDSCLSKELTVNNHNNIKQVTGNKFNRVVNFSQTGIKRYRPY